MEVLKVSGKSNPNSVAGAISGVVKEHGIVEVHGVGANAVNQTVKAIAIARGHLAVVGMDLVCAPAFASAILDDEEVTSIKFIVQDRRNLSKQMP